MALEWLTNWFRGSSVEDPLGDRGENVAAKYLRNLEYRILIRNFACKFGEVDIIARDGKTLVFVEVKTRKEGEDNPEPDEQVNYEKQRKITRCADYYLARYGNNMPPVRFDVVAVTWPRNQEPIIRHITDAFAATR
jgi:putative endonuclease